MRQLRLLTPSSEERRREVSCRICLGDRLKCIKSTCPVLLKVRAFIDVEKHLNRTSFFGASPPGIFVGQWGYPHVLAGPLVPSLSFDDPAITDASDRWLNLTMDELVRFRFALVRGKTPIHIKMARAPDATLATLQEAVMSSRPVDTEVKLKKKPSLTLSLFSRGAPLGPSASMETLKITDNPSVPRPLERAVSDIDLKANSAVYELYHKGVAQRQLVRVFSAGLLGLKQERRMVPTEWSITAIDDIIGRVLHRQVLNYPPLNEYLVAGHVAFGNSVQILLMPTPWMYEAMEAWTAFPDAPPAEDYELTMGRRDYPKNLLGAYHAVKLPVLEYLNHMRRQAGVVVFLEVRMEWIPLGVWRFREIAREALETPRKAASLKDALFQIQHQLSTPMDKWLSASKLLPYVNRQRSIDHFLGDTTIGTAHASI